jgi:hypothetical protein
MKISALSFVFLFATILNATLPARPTQAESLFGNIIALGDTAGDTQTQPNGDETSGDNGETPPPPNASAPFITSFNVSRTLAGGSEANRSVVITGEATDDDVASCQVLINGVFQAECIPKENAANTYSLAYTWVVPNDQANKLQSGAYTISFVVIDSANNQTERDATITVDTDAPDLTVQGGGLIQSGSLSPNVTAKDDGNDVTQGYSWTASSDNPSVILFDRSAKEPVFTPKVEGTYVFYLTVQDGLGNAVTKPFTFDYAPVLATIPLPTIQDPTLTLQTNASDDTEVATPAIRSTQDMAASDDVSVLGNTIAAAAKASPVTTASPLTPTKSGWSIFGILWYWWAVVAGIMVSAWYFIKKFFDVRLPEQV